ncbi:MAG: FlaD/FlaE family flagellar protein [Thermoplasmatota archaeon]
MSLLSRISKKGAKAEPALEQEADSGATRIPGLPDAPAAAPPKRESPAVAEKPSSPSVESEAIERSVKEMNENMARLASSIESMKKERSDVTDKLAGVEDRMRKLSSLTELLSSPFNPFVGDQPAREGRAPRMGAAPPAGAYGPPSPGIGFAMPPIADITEAPLAGANGIRELIPLSASHSAYEDDEESEGAGEAMVNARMWSHASAQTASTSAPPPAAAQVDVSPTSPGLAETPGPGTASSTESAPVDSRLDRIGTNVESSILVLHWCNALLRASSREQLPHLLQYYEEIGWLGNEARAAVERVASGIYVDPHTNRGLHHATERDDDPDSDDLDWRATADLHEQSLLYIERLRMVSRSPASP